MHAVLVTNSITQASAILLLTKPTAWTCNPIKFSCLCVLFKRTWTERITDSLFQLDNCWTNKNEIWYGCSAKGQYKQYKFSKYYHSTVSTMVIIRITPATFQLETRFRLWTTSLAYWPVKLWLLL